MENPANNILLNAVPQNSAYPGKLKKKEVDLRLLVFAPVPGVDGPAQNYQNFQAGESVQNAPVSTISAQVRVFL